MGVRQLSLAAACWLPFLGSVAAQNRMPLIPPDKMTDAQKKVVQEMTEGPRGGMSDSGPFVSLLRSPELLTRQEKVGEYLKNNSALGPKLTEFVILMTAREWTQQFVFSGHSKAGLRAGLKQDVITGIAEGRRPSGMLEDEEIVFDFYTELHEIHAVSNATYERASKKLGEQGIIDMIGTIGYYATQSMMLNVARTPLPKGTVPPLAVFPQ